MMLNTKTIFVIAISLALGTALMFGSKSFGINLENHYVGMTTGLGLTGSTVILVKLRSWIRFIAFYKNKIIGGESELGKLLGLSSITLRDNYVIAKGPNKTVAHAYFRITNIPYLLDDLDKEKKLWNVGNFVRLLSSCNFPFELIPRIMPVPASVYLHQINKEIDNLKLTLSAEGNTASPRRQARLRYLEKISDRLLEGEGVRDTSFLVHLMAEGKYEDPIVRELEANARTLMSALESGLNVRAERLSGVRMLEVLREFFRASLKVNPPKVTRMLTWDLAYLIPLARPKFPPLEKLLHGVYLGRTNAGGVVCLDIKRYANPHVVCLGKSGYGKSTTVKTLTSRMYDLWESNILILDYAGEYSPWVRSRNGRIIDMHTAGLNPFELGKATLNDRVRQLIDTFTKLSELTLPQRNLLSYYLMKAYEARGFKPSDSSSWTNEAPNLHDLIDLIEADLSKFRMGKQMTAMALMEKLSAISSGPIGIFRKSTFAVSELTQGFVCVDLSKVTSNIMKDMIAYTILQHIDSEMRLNGLRNGVQVAIVLDEAWKLCREEDSLPVTIIKEGRKYGYSLIVSSQDATADLAESILANAGTVIIHHTEHPKYLRFFEMSFGITKQEISRVQNAPIGEALVKIGDDPRPFFVGVEMEDIVEGRKEGFPSQGEMGQNLVDLTEEGNIWDELDSNDKIRTPYQPDKLSANAQRLLEEIARDAGYTTTDYYRMLALNPYQGNLARKELEECNLVEGRELPKSTMGRAGRTLQLTDKARQLLKVKPGDRHGGAVHQRMIKLIARKFTDHKVEIEYPVGVGRTTDLVIDRRIAIEVETRDFSKSNITKNLDAGFEKVILVCQNKQQAVQFQSKVNENFLGEPRIVVTHLASFMTSFEIVETKKN
jgi:DNA helicase HerA-like ATPase